MSQTITIKSGTSANQAFWSILGRDASNELNILHLHALLTAILTQHNKEDVNGEERDDMYKKLSSVFSAHQSAHDTIPTIHDRTTGADLHRAYIGYMKLQEHTLEYQKTVGVSNFIVQTNYNGEFLALDKCKGCLSNLGYTVDPEYVEEE